MRMQSNSAQISRIFMKFGNKKNCLDLLENGTIYCNPITSFIREDGTARQDKYENTDEIIAGTMSMKMEEHNILMTPSIPATLRFLKPARHNLYCLCSIDGASQLRGNRFYIDKRFKTDFGDYFIFIRDTAQFADRLSKGINEQGYGVEHRAITYKPLKNYVGKVDSFTKDEAFSWQLEYRFKFYTGKNEKFCFKIGNMEDIAFMLPSDTEYLEFKIG